MTFLTCGTNIKTNPDWTVNNVSSVPDVIFFKKYVILQEQDCVKPVTKCEISTQTDIHPTETNIDKSYEWNEWELRREALKLVSRINLLFIA